MTLALTSNPGGRERSQFVWSALANGATGDAAVVNFHNATRACVQASGTFGAGGSVTLEGSLDGTNFAALSDGFGNAATFTAAGLKTLGEWPLWLRAHCTAGDETTALNVAVMLWRSL